MMLNIDRLSSRSAGLPVAPCRVAKRISLVLLLLFNASAAAQETASATEAASLDSAEPAASDAISIEQARLADRFKRLEEVVGRLAELSASNDPRRAKLLREAIAQSREQDISVRFDSVVKLLEEERLSAAAKNQTELQKELDMLLTLLLKADRDKELASERERVRQYLKEVGRLIRLQKGVRARTEGSEDADELRGLGADQQRVADDTAKLGGSIAKTEGEQTSAQEEAEQEEKPATDKSEQEQADSQKEGKPGDPKEGKSGSGESCPNGGDCPGCDEADGKPCEGNSEKPGEQKSSQQGQQSQGGQPSSQSPEGEPTEQANEPQQPAERAIERLRAAQKNMEDARKKLGEAERKGASQRQREALKELEQAKAELERVLRQLREEELERTLAQLAARFRKMLEVQTVVYEGTVRLDQVPQRQRDHDDEIEAARLSRQELQIVADADKALLLLREEGSSVAFPEAIQQMRGDMQQIAERLAAVKVDGITQGLEQDVIAALEETIAALEKAMKDLEKNRTPPGQSAPAGPQGDPQLVDKLAELKMIRSLQVRIYNRTQRYGEMIAGEQADTAELLAALAELAERQQRVHRATADLQLGRND